MQRVPLIHHPLSDDEYSLYWHGGIEVESTTPPYAGSVRMVLGTPSSFGSDSRVAMLIGPNWQIADRRTSPSGSIYPFIVGPALLLVFGGALLTNNWSNSMADELVYVYGDEYRTIVEGASTGNIIFHCGQAGDPDRDSEYYFRYQVSSAVFINVVGSNQKAYFLNGYYKFTVDAGQATSSGSLIFRSYEGNENSSNNIRWFYGTLDTNLNLSRSDGITYPEDVSAIIPIIGEMAAEIAENKIDELLPPAISDAVEQVKASSNDLYVSC